MAKCGPGLERMVCWHPKEVVEFTALLVSLMLYCNCLSSEKNTQEKEAIQCGG